MHFCICNEIYKFVSLETLTIIIRKIKTKGRNFLAISLVLSVNTVILQRILILLLQFYCSWIVIIVIKEEV